MGISAVGYNTPLNVCKKDVTHQPAFTSTEAGTLKEKKGNKALLYTTLSVLAAAGIYIATKGKSKKHVTPNVLEKTFSNGNKVVIKEAVLLTKDGLTPARQIFVYDKSGKIIKEKSKAITKSVNKATGKNM